MDDDRNVEYDTIEGDSEEIGPKRSIEGWIIFVTGIQEESTEDDIATPFGDFGAIKNIHLNIDRRTGFLKVNSLTHFDQYLARHRVVFIEVILLYQNNARVTHLSSTSRLVRPKMH